MVSARLTVMASYRLPRDATVYSSHVDEVDVTFDYSICSKGPGGRPRLQAIVALSLTLALRSPARVGRTSTTAHLPSTVFNRTPGTLPPAVARVMHKPGEHIIASSRAK